MPVTTPIIVASTVPPSASQNVWGNLSAISVETGAPGSNRDAEIPRERVHQEMPELNGQRAVEPELVADARDDFRRRFEAGGELRRVAGNQVDDQEDKERDAEEHQDELEEGVTEVPPE